MDLSKTEETIQTEPKYALMEAGIDPLFRTAAYLLLADMLIWVILLVRWVTFSSLNLSAISIEWGFSQFPPIIPYIVYAGFLVLNLVTAVGLLRGISKARTLGIVRAILGLLFAVIYYLVTREFWGAVLLTSVSGLLLALLLKHTAWALAYPAAFWLGLFFVIPMGIVFVVSLGERTRLGTVSYPAFSLSNLGIYFNDYARFFSKIGGDYIYLRIFWRSVWIAMVNTVLCLLVGYPFSYWIARRPIRYRSMLIFLVMIPFWTNFLVRTYAWMLILRDSGLINNIWTITLHDQAVMLSGNSQFFTWLASITANKLPLLFNQPAVMMGLFYGYLPFMILPLYSNLEQIDWSLMDAASDLGANALQSFVPVLIPLSLPGIVAGCVIVFIPSLGAYVTPDLMGGAKVSLLGNLLQQQFMTVRDWPFGSAIGFIMMAIMLAATLIYFRTLAKNQEFTA